MGTWFKAKVVKVTKEETPSSPDEAFLDDVLRYFVKRTDYISGLQIPFPLMPHYE